MLRKAEVVRDTAVAPFLLYRLCRDAGPQGRLVRAILDALGAESDFRRERSAALSRSRGREIGKP
ncbi:MAG: hypothetical protein FJ206_16225 [Gemmatimonadetes bacterium]|nr:hypothetical protein [Gemmatimonadota bacterium]